MNSRTGQMILCTVWLGCREPDKLAYIQLYPVLRPRMKTIKCGKVYSKREAATGVCLSIVSLPIPMYQPVELGLVHLIQSYMQ